MSLVQLDATPMHLLTWLGLAWLGLSHALCRFTLLATLSVQCTPWLLLQLHVDNEQVRTGSLKVCQQMLLGYQDSPIALHNSLPLIPSILHSLANELQTPLIGSAANQAQALSAQVFLQLAELYRAQDQASSTSSSTSTTPSTPTIDLPVSLQQQGRVSSTTTNADGATQQQLVDSDGTSTMNAATLCHQLTQLIHVLIFRHSGYPELYEPIFSTLNTLDTQCTAFAQCHSRPSEEQCTSILAQYNWSHHGTIALPRAITDQKCHQRQSSRTHIAGLVNLGNTCYMNSYLQALHMCSAFRTAIVRQATRRPNAHSRSIISQLARLFVYQRLSQRQSIAPRSLLSVLPACYQHGVQHDAAEFGRQLLDFVEREQLTSGGNNASDTTRQEQQCDTNLLRSIFGGTIESQVHCSACATCSSSHEHVIDLALAIPSASASVLSLSQLLEHYLGQEKLVGDNRYFCAKCQSLQDAVKQLRIVKAPEHLVLTLNYFACDMHGRRSKIRAAIDYPMEIRLPVHDTATTPSATDGLSHQAYRLYAIVIHSGQSLDCGHYYTYARPSHGSTSTTQQQWLRLNDSTVTPVEHFEASIRRLSIQYPSDVPYILSYKRISSLDDDDDADDDEQTLLADQPLASELVAEIQRDNAKLLTEEQQRPRQQSLAARLQRLHRDVEDGDEVDDLTPKYVTRFDRDGGGGAGGGFAGFGPNRFIR
jgi:ubiquitin C-terminal hydrolase